MENENISDMDIIMLPGRLMFFIWLNNLFHKKIASFDKDNGNIINLSPAPSSWFSIGKNFENNRSFIGIQDRMLPWFFEIEWKKAIISKEKGKLYLSCSKENENDIAIAINIRKKRLNVLWNEKSKNNIPELDFRIIKVMQSGNVEVSEIVYKKIPLVISENIEDITAKPIVKVKKEQEYEDVIKSKFDNLYNDKFSNSTFNPDDIF